MVEKWKRKLKEKLNQAVSDDRGSAFVAVIIGVTALMIIGTTVMSLATNYVITVIVDQNVTENFYETEGVLGEVRSGLEEICGKANEYAYMEVINNYNSTSTTTDDTLSSTMETKSDVYAVKYLTGIVSLLKNPGMHTLNNATNTVDNRMDNTNGWDGIDQPTAADWKSFDIEPIKKMVTRPSTLGSTYGGGGLRYGFRIEREGGSSTGKIEKMYLIISGIKVDYTDPEGYRSVVQTDIRINVPDYGFEGNATLDELKKYIVICDDKLSVAHDALNIGFTGNVYTGGEHDHGNYKTGIEICPNAKDISFDSDMIISRGDMDVQDKADVRITNQDGEMWLKNIILSEASGGTPDDTPGLTIRTSLELFTNSYILDDLSIDNKNSEVNLGGKYYGYSYNKENTVTSPDDTKAEYSSAILVNGKNTTLKSDSLSKLILAGRTFVSRFEDDASTEPDIRMGESLAVKSNQVAYLVPDDCILPVGDGHNPLLETEVIGDNYMASVNLPQLKNTIAWPYLNETKPVIANYNNDGGYVYLYLNFKSQKDANDYFSKFYSDDDNKEILDERAQTYISTLDSNGMKLGASLYLIAGNIIHNYYAADGSVKQAANYFDGSGNPNGDMLRDGQKKMQNYLGKQLSLLNSGYKTGMASRYELLDSSSQKQLVRDRIIDFDKIDADSGIMDIRKPNTDTSIGGEVFITPGNYTLDGSVSRGLIICGGAVTVMSNFEGLIIAKNGVQVNGTSMDLKANTTMVGSLMEMIRNDPELSKYFYDLNEDPKDDTNVADCIHYENWERDNEGQLAVHGG